MIIIARLLIIGTGGHGRSVLDCALATGQYDDIVFLTNDLSCKDVAGFPVLHEQRVDFKTIERNCDVFVAAIGDNRVRGEQYHKRFVDRGFVADTILHPQAAVSPFAKLQPGTVVLAGAVVGPFAMIGNACIINTSSVVEHDCVLGDFVHISPGAMLGGNVHVGEQSWVGIGASVIHKVHIGAHSIIAAGASVIHNVPPQTMVAGVPAVVKKIFEGELSVE